MTNYLNDDNFINSLHVLWDYMILNHKLEPCDVIIGCGCKDLDIPIRCAELYKNGMAKKILFAGGLGKGTEDKFVKAEAEIFRNIAIENGVSDGDILIEKESTNTVDNFRFGIKVLENNHIKCDSIIIVHHALSERRTFATAKAFIKNKKLFITSPITTFDEFINSLKNDDGRETVEILLGDVQRIVIYPQFGWQIENNFPDTVLEAYNYIKGLGFVGYLVNNEKINELINEYGIVEGKEANYFY